MNDLDADALAGHLDRAIAELITARVVLGIRADIDPPTDALDEALRLDEKKQDARRTVKEALDCLTDAEGPDARQRAVYTAEERMNALVAVSLDVGFIVGRTAGRNER